MIPKIIHHIWLTDNPVKAPELRLSFMVHNIRWSFMMWTRDTLCDAAVPGDVKQFCRDQTVAYVVRGDCLRYALLYAYGGIYTDMDVLCNKPLDPLLDTPGFSSLSYKNEYGNTTLGCIPGYPPAGELANMTFTRARENSTAGGVYVEPLEIMGVWAQAPLLKTFHTIHPVHFFQPFSWNDLEGRKKLWPDSYTVHQWHGMDHDGWTKKRF